MPARCETCHFWIPSKAYVEGGTEGQQTGHCKFSPEGVRTQSYHWCGKWQEPVIGTLSENIPAHAAEARKRWELDVGARLNAR